MLSLYCSYVLEEDFEKKIIWKMIDMFILNVYSQGLLQVFAELQDVL